MGQSLLFWKGTGDIPPLNEKIWIFEVEHEQFISQDLRLGYIYDHRSSWIFTPRPKPSLDMRILEMFSGSFGGWKAAMRFLHQKTDFAIQTVSVDHDQHGSLHFALSHAVNWVKTTNHLTDRIFVHSTEDWVVSADVLDQRLLKPLSLWAPQAATLSPPCPPWSVTGHGGGLLRTEGRLLLRVILHLRWLNVPFILLENVKGMTRHEHFDMVKQTFHFAGYRMLWQRIADLQDLTRVTRPRWLALWGKVHHETPPMPSQFWERIDRSFMPDPLMHLQPKQLEEMRLPADALSLAQDPHFLKINGHAFAVGLNEVDVLSVRTYRGGTIPCFLARYGTQHLLDKQMLRDQGYHCHFACTKDFPEQCRYWSPSEVALVHGITSPIYLPNDHFVAWFGLGNMIAVQHAMLALVNMLGRCAECSLDLKQLLADFRNEQFLAKDVYMKPIAKGYMLCLKGTLFTQKFDASAKVIYELLETMEPMFWSPKHGIVPLAKAHWTFQNSLPSQISQTMEDASDEEIGFCSPTFQACIHFQDHSTKFWFSGDLPRESILAVWDNRFECQFFDVENPTVLELRPTDLVPPRTFGTDSCVAVLLDTELTLMLNRPVPVEQQPQLTMLAKPLFSQVGELDISKKLLPSAVLLDRPLQTPFLAFDFVHLLGAFTQLQIEWTWDSSMDQFTCHTTGEETSKQIWARFWCNLLSTNDQALLGRHVLQDVDDSKITFTSGDQGVCPMQPFRLALISQATKAILQQLSSQMLPTDQAQHVQIRWGSDVLWEGTLADTTSLQVLHSALNIAFTVLFNGWPLRFLHKGKQVMPERILSEFQDVDTQVSTTFHLIAALQGGGAKTQQKQLQQTSIAAVLLDQGYTLDWITPTIDTLMQKTQPHHIASIAAMPMGTGKISAIAKLCKDLEIEMPEPVKPQSRRATAATPWQKPKRSKQEVIDPAEFTIVPNYFFNEDDTPTSQITQIRAQTSGLCLMNCQMASCWLREGTPISSDELGIVIIGPVIETSLPAHSVTFPCFNADGARVLLHGTLVQLGSKHIKCKTTGQAPIVAESCVLVAITLHKTDFEASQWQDALHSTPAFIKRILRQDQLDNSLIAIWGRSLRAGRAPASPLQATTIQMHCTIEQDKLKQVLKASGFNSLFCTPKQENGRLSVDFRLIWIGSDMVAAVAKSAQVTGCLGLVKGRNGALALRFDKQSYEAAWKQLCPGQTLPLTNDQDKTYKIQGLPFGCTDQTLSQWANSVGWDLKPHKALGPTAWLVKATTRPSEDEILMFNNQPLLVTYLAPKVNANQQVLLGPKSKQAAQQDPLTNADPWGGWKPTSAPVQPPPQAQPRVISGPMEAKFQAHDEQIAKLQADVSKLAANQESHTQQVTAQFQEAAAREQQAAISMQQSLNQLQTNWDATFKKTMDHHSRSMDQQFRELKSLFSKNKRKPDTPEDEDMGGSWLSPSCVDDFDSQADPVGITVLLLSFLLMICRWIFMSISCSPILRSQYRCHAVRTQLCHGGRFLRCLVLLSHIFGSHACALGSGSHSVECYTLGTASFLPCVQYCLPPADLPVLTCLNGRIGEAANPGPSTRIPVRLAITNPTSIVSKEIQFRSLQQEHGVQIAVAAETAATVKGQRVFSAKIKHDFPKVVWSPPVAPKRERSDGDESLRGQPIGVAVLSRHPLRMARGTLPEAVRQTCRLIHTVVAIGPIHVQIVAIYAYTPGGHPNAPQQNSDLIHHALDAASHLRLPLLIMGDFNGNPFQWECSARLRSLGMVDLDILHRQLHGSPLPPTCRQVTTPDNCLCCPFAASQISKIQVLETFMFDCHSPVLVDFQVDPKTFATQALSLPKSFLELPIDLSYMDSAYSQASTNAKPVTLEDWGRVVEHAADLAFRQTQADTGVHHIQGLPRAYRGRCQPKTLKKIPFQAMVRPGRPGDYNPLTEVHTFQGQRMVTQVRRLQSLVRGLSRPTPNLQVLQREWTACLRDTSFEGSFVKWCMSQPEIGPVPCQLPTLDLLTDISQLAKFTTDGKLYQDHQCWINKTKYRRYMDKQYGHTQAYAMLRQYKPPVTEVVETARQSAILVNHGAHAELYVEDATCFDEVHVLEVNGKPVQVTNRLQHSFQLSPPPDIADGEVQVTQTHCHFQPQIVASKLNDYWRPFWQVDNPEAVDHAVLDNALQHVPEGILEQVDPFQIDDWTACIRRLKPHSARGVDGISAAELRVLPRQAIVDLVSVVSQYSQGFPEWIMLAKTHAIPKIQGKISAAQVRPITVLAQIVRLWSQVLTRCIIRCLSQHFPAELTGFLPGRSPLDACYKAQRLLEEARRTSQVMGGCCMDLLKCFNTIRRRVPLAVLRKLGLAEIHLEQWQSSMSRLKRTWCLPSYTSDPIEVNNGMCEGDPFSVVGMLSLGFLWVTNVRAHDTSSPISAFADNWSWSSYNSRRFDGLAHTTQTIVDLSGMIVDWDKSWIWCTQSEFLQPLQQALRRIAPTMDIRRLSHEMDLGCIMQYSGSHRLGKFTKRIQEGHRRLHTLSTMQHDMSTKAHLIKTAIYPQMFYGVELLPLGMQHFDKMRNQLAASLLGKSPSRNSALAIAHVPHFMDPEPFVICQAVKAARRHLIRASQAEVDAFCHMLSRHSGRWMDCHGPAGSLKYYLSKLGWTVNGQGHIQVNGFVTLNLLTTGLPSLRMWIHRTWQEELLPRFCNRAELRGLQSPDLLATHQILKTFRPKEQKQILNEISGAFQTAQQQAAWDPDCDGLCIHCGQADTRYHRVHECPVTHQLRVDSRVHLDWFLDRGAPLHEFPVVHGHEDTDWLLTFFHAIKPCPIPPHLHRLLTQLDAQDHMLTFYTDGSRQHPESVTTRFAGYAVVLDSSSDPAQRAFLANQFQQTQIRPGTLHLVVSALLQGEASIHRAELAALVYICEAYQNTCVFTDSQYALSVARKCLSREPLCAFAFQDNFDLIIRLWHATASGRRQFHKVKAHEDLSEHTGEDLYHCLGNAVANDAAISTTTYMTPTLRKQLENRHLDITAQQLHLKHVYKFHLEAHKTRAIAEALLRNQPELTTPARTIDRQALASFTVPEPWTVPPARCDRLQACAFGHTMAQLVIQWMQQVKWPTEPDQVPLQDMGISWIELTLSFMMHSGVFVPVRRADEEGCEKLLVLRTLEDANTHGVKMSDLSLSFSVMHYQVLELIAPGPWPPVAKMLNKSLYVQGAKIHTQGFAWRAQIPCQQEVAQLLTTYLRFHKGPSFAALPDIQLPDSGLYDTIHAETRGNWTDRMAAARAASRHIKKWRERMRGQRELVFWTAVGTVLTWIAAQIEKCTFSQCQTNDSTNTVGSWTAPMSRKGKFHWSAPLSQPWMLYGLLRQLPSSHHNHWLWLECQKYESVPEMGSWFHDHHGWHVWNHHPQIHDHPWHVDQVGIPNHPHEE